MVASFVETIDPSEEEIKPGKRARQEMRDGP